MTVSKMEDNNNWHLSSFIHLTGYIPVLWSLSWLLQHHAASVNYTTPMPQIKFKQPKFILLDSGSPRVNNAKQVKPNEEKTILSKQIPLGPDHNIKHNKKSKTSKLINSNKIYFNWDHRKNTEQTIKLTLTVKSLTATYIHNLTIFFISGEKQKFQQLQL